MRQNPLFFSDFRLNTLYLYENYGDEYPHNFWLLNNLKELTFLDFHTKAEEKPNQEFILEIAFDCEILKLKFAHLEDLEKWQKILENAQNFQAENYFLSSSQIQKISHKKIYICIDAKMILTFFHQNGIFRKETWIFQTEIVNIKMKELKPECTMVVKNDDIWRITFSHTEACTKFVKFLDCWSCEGK